jgi:hypothetical protein
MKAKFLLCGLAAALVFSLAVAMAPHTSVQANPPPDPELMVYTYAKLLPKNAKLTDGDETKFEFTDTTWFTWVDLMPAAKFTHPTVYIFVSADKKIRVEDGGWWPELDGKIILYGEDPYEIKFPVDIYSETGISQDPEVKVYAYPKLITPQDKLTDGGETPIKIEKNTLLYWVDLKPGYRFAHPTAYILISADDKVKVVKGSWWPELNGNQILYGQDPTALKFPYPVD